MDCFSFIDTFLSGNEMLHQEAYVQEHEKALQWGSHIMFMIIVHDNLIFKIIPNI
jgi:hypothetical protein